MFSGIFRDEPPDITPMIRVTRLPEFFSSNRLDATALYLARRTPAFSDPPFHSNTVLCKAAIPLPSFYRPGCTWNFTSRPDCRTVTMTGHLRSATASHACPVATTRCCAARDNQWPDGLCTGIQSLTVRNRPRPNQAAYALRFSS